MVVQSRVEATGVGRTNYRVVTIEEMGAIAEQLARSTRPVGIDTETTGLDPRLDKLVTLQLGRVDAQYILDTRPYYSASEAQKAAWREALQGALDKLPRVVGHNIKFDYEMLFCQLGVRLPALADTMLQEQVLHAGQDGVRYSLEETAARYGIASSKDLQKWSVDLDKREAWHEPFPEDFLGYCAQDVVLPCLVYLEQRIALRAAQLGDTAELENAVLPVVAHMELHGALIDVERWRALVERLEEKHALLKAEITGPLTEALQAVQRRQQAERVAALDAWEAERRAVEGRLALVYEQTLLQGLSWAVFKREHLKTWTTANPKPAKPLAPCTEINLDSPVQLRLALNEMGVPVEKTSKDALKPYAARPFIKALLAYGSLSTLLGAFGAKFLSKVGRDGRLHTTFNQLGADTGRFSSSNPNSQNIPREREDLPIRQCFIAPPGYKLFTADFSNIEARVAADMSKDRNMLSLFDKAGDLHSNTARLMFGLGEADPAQTYYQPGLSHRQAAKKLNFGLFYGMGAVTLAWELETTVEVSKALKEQYYETYPAVGVFLREQSRQGVRLGYALTAGGRRKYFDSGPQPAWDRYDPLESRARRDAWYASASRYTTQAMNAPIQGTSADITKKCLILLRQALPAEAHIILCIHDEIVVEAPEALAASVKGAMEDSFVAAQRCYLHTVATPPPDVVGAAYWSKH